MTAAAADFPRNERALYIDGMRELMDALEANPSIPLPYQGTGMAMTFHFLMTADPRAEMAAAAVALPCDWRKVPREFDSGPAYLDLQGAIRGVQVTLTAFREDVCRRVVTGTREVTRTVKDPDALAQVPEVEITETVEDVTWECGPLLAAAIPGDDEAQKADAA